MKLIRTNLNGMELWYRENDRVIGQRIALDKYEKYETAIMMSQIDKNNVVVDVGANIGYYTLLMAQRAKKVYAVEPDREIFGILERNVGVNNLKNVVLINCAAGAKNGKLKYYKNEENDGDGRVYRSKNGKFMGFISCLRLDDILANEQYISSIKADVQGWEPAVIAGAKKIIEKNSPTLFLEYSPSDYRDNKLDGKGMIDYLEKRYRNIWSINDFAEVPWPIHRGVKILGKAGYADLWLKKKMGTGDYLTMLKNVNYRKFFKGIMG
jgi:FkbM family methyltransferase